MPRYCPSCGAFVTGNTSNCPNCGAVMSGVVNLDKPQQFQSNSNANYQPNVNTDYQPMTVGQWIGTIIFTSCFSFVSLIVTIIWAFAPTTPEPKRSFCKAWLVVMVIFSVLGIVFIVVLASVIGPELEKYDYLKEIFTH